ncbi:hypothetical protein [Lentibacillus sediminis]|uniref:hypothetical protein n=1 Tax=Lentibacillus sediminis TaxID=1940529 RepID=UPI000C1C0133|nr:hypothetical protein [Lentibacillus sediminis]
MSSINSSDELMERISNMDRDNSVLQFSIPGKGKFTLVLQEETETTIAEGVENNSELKQMIKESQQQYKEGKGMTTSGLLESFSAKDFE